MKTKHLICKHDYHPYSNLALSHVVRTNNTENGGFKLVPGATLEVGVQALIGGQVGPRCTKCEKPKGKPRDVLFGVYYQVWQLPVELLVLDVVNGGVDLLGAAAELLTKWHREGLIKSTLDLADQTPTANDTPHECWIDPSIEQYLKSSLSWSETLAKLREVEPEVVSPEQHHIRFNPKTYLPKY